MNVSLTKELESRVRARVESGMYNNASEVINEALRFWELHGYWIHQLKKQQFRELVQVGIDQIERGDYTTINSEEELDAYFNEIMDSNP